MAYGYGRPSQSIEASGADGNPLETLVKIVHVRQNDKRAEYTLRRGTRTKHGQFQAIREVLADSVVADVALGRGAKPRCSAQSVQSTIP